MRFSFWLAPSVLLWFFASSVSAATITLSDSYLAAMADANDGSQRDEDIVHLSLFSSGTLAASQGGENSAVEYDLSKAGFEITFSHARAAAPNSVSAESIGQIYFSTDRNIDYSVDGAYSAIDPEGREIYIRVFLVDYTDGWDDYVELFHNVQISENTPDESLLLGHQTAEYNLLRGSATGTLIANRLYEFYFLTYIDSSLTGASGAATATGFVSLTFVPEPGTGLLAMSGLLVLAVGRRRR